MHLFFLIFMCSKLYMPLFDFWLIIVSRDTYICIYMIRPLVGFMSYHHMWDDNLVYTRKHKCEYASDGIPVNSIHYIWDILYVMLIWILIHWCMISSWPIHMLITLFRYSNQIFCSFLHWYTIEIQGSDPTSWSCICLWFDFIALISSVFKFGFAFHPCICTLLYLTNDLASTIRVPS